MARTYRCKGRTPYPTVWIGGRERKRRGPNRILDKDLQRLPERSAYHDGISARLSWPDEFGGMTFSKAQRLTKRAQINEYLNE